MEKIRESLAMDTLRKQAVLKLPLPPAESAIAPTEEDVRLNELFGREVAEVCPEVTPGMAVQQTRALAELHSMFKGWCRQPFHMFVSGSYRLNVHSDDADIDVLFVTTSAITRKAVFSEFVNILQASPDASEVQPIPNARVPIIGMKLFNQEFDILTCHLRVATLPSRDDLLLSYEWMNGLEDASILAFNGPRLTELILLSVPRPTQFRTALKYLRHWAKCRMVYSNKSGFLGGVNFALMLAYVARRHPKALAYTLVNKFFDVYGSWKWSRSRPLRLDEHVPHECPVWLQAFEWTSRHTEVMVVLTPCFPRFNTTFTVSAFTSNILLREFHRASKLLKEGAGMSLNALCGPVEVVSSCQRFIEVAVSAPTTSEGKNWQGYVESQCRYLVEYLSREQLAIEEFRSIPQWTASVHAGTCVKTMYVTAQDDGKIRTFLIQGSLEQPLNYFLDAHAGNGPPQPKTSSIAVRFCGRMELPSELLTRFGAEPVAPDETIAQVKMPAKRSRADVWIAAASPKQRVPPSPFKKLRWILAPSTSASVGKIVRPVVFQGCCVTPFDVYIGHECVLAGVKFADCGFSVPGPCQRASRAETLEAYSLYAQERRRKDKTWSRAVSALQGKVLACWCVDTTLCHGSVLLRLARCIENKQSKGRAELC
jgi:poly(A) polymerase